MDIKELEITAQLAHLTLDKDQLNAIFPQFEQTIGFFDSMEKAETDPSFIKMMQQNTKPPDRGKSPPPPTALFVDAQALRDDTVDTAEKSALVEELLNNAGDRDGNFFKIPNVL